MPCWGNSWKWRSNTLLDLTLCAEAEFGRWITLLFEATSAKFDFREIMSRLSRWSSFIQVWKEIFPFLKLDQHQTLRVSGHVSVDRVTQLANSFWTLRRWQQPLPRNHGDAVTVGTLWGLAAGVRTSMVMNRAAKKYKKIMYFFWDVHSLTCNRCFQWCGTWE